MLIMTTMWSEDEAEAAAALPSRDARVAHPKTQNSKVMTTPIRKAEFM
jgi:hypothetical protein